MVEMERWRGEEVNEERKDGGAIDMLPRSQKPKIEVKVFMEKMFLLTVGR